MNSLKEMIKRSKCCIIGVPDHQAIIHVGGRVGAIRGPASFRRIFSGFKGRVSPSEDFVDLGDVKNLTVDVKNNHRLAATFIRDGHLGTNLSVIIGGGHDHGYSHLLGIYEALQQRFLHPRLGCINIDAHLDVRKPDPLITSGSPFYLAIESGILNPRRFIEFGIQSHCNGPELLEYAESKKIKTISFSQLREGRAVPQFRKVLKKLLSSCDGIVISLDLDAAASSYAPGVSAPQAEGFTAMEIIQMMEIAGKETKVISLGVFELNPEHDVDSRTARLAATAAYHFAEYKLGSL